MMNSTAPEKSASATTPPLVIDMPQAQVPQLQQAPRNTSSFASPEETGQRLLAMLEDVLPMVDQDPAVLSLMQDVSKMIYEYE